MTGTTRELAQEVLQCLDALGGSGCGDQDHRLYTGKWIEDTRAAVQKYLAPTPHLDDVQQVQATVYTQQSGHAKPARYGLDCHIEKNQLLCYVLNQPLLAGDVMQLSDVGHLPVNVMAMVRGQRLRWAANVHCGACGDFGAHMVEVPHAWLRNDEPYLVRRCMCGDTWRQYAAVVAR